MTHEVKQLFEQVYHWQSLGVKSVLVTVVALNGSSYRRPGVRMLLNDRGDSVGAVSGGCVEKEVFRQAQSVLDSGNPKMMTYDGRLRLGCEGILYLLLERIEISEEFYYKFKDGLLKRSSFEIESYYSLEIGENPLLGSICHLNGSSYSLCSKGTIKIDPELNSFSQKFPPLFQLYIFGAEHDAVQVCKASVLLGWEVTIVADPDEQKTIDFFPGASKLMTPLIEDFDVSHLDAQTAVILMTHSFNRDLQYLTRLTGTNLAYLGMLGPITRRERLLSLLMEYQPNTPFEFIESLHAPAGINIGAESASEIAVSIISEILSVIRQQDPMPLREKTGKIHG